MRWQLITATLCIYGLLKEFKPIEPYLYQYHTEYMNISSGDLWSKVYPIWTYSYLLFTIPSLLLTDLLLYKPILIVESLSYITVWLLLIYGRSVFGQQISQLFYGCATATEIAYFAYIYVKVDRSKYERVTVWTRAALQVGKCLAYFGSQLLLMLNWGDYLTLNYISLASVSMTLIFALSLPFVHWRSVISADIGSSADTLDVDAVAGKSNQKSTSNYGSASTDSTSNESRRSISTMDLEVAVTTVPHISPLPLKECSKKGKQIKLPETYCQFVAYRIRQFKFAVLHGLFANPEVLKWSIWWALSTCGDLQVGNYIQSLWKDAQPNLKSSEIHNGFVEGSIPLLISVALLVMEKARINWSKWGQLCLAFAAIIQASMLLTMSLSWNIYVIYAGYAVFRILYQCMITIAQFNIVCQIAANTCGFIFGVNMFLALFVQAILTFVVCDEHGLFAIKSIRQQFYVYAGYHASIALIFFSVIIYDFFSKRSVNRNATNRLAET